MAGLFTFAVSIAGRSFCRKTHRILRTAVVVQASANLPTTTATITRMVRRNIPAVAGKRVAMPTVTIITTILIMVTTTQQ